MANRKYTNEIIITSLKKVLKGEYLSDVSHEEGVPLSQVRAWCKKAGISYRKKAPVYLRDWEMIKRAIGMA